MSSLTFSASCCIRQAFIPSLSVSPPRTRSLSPGLDYSLGDSRTVSLLGSKDPSWVDNLHWEGFTQGFTGRTQREGWAVKYSASMKMSLLG